MKRFFCLFLVFICLCGAAFAETLNLPADLVKIDARAFYGDTDLDCVIVPDGTLEIGSKAFAYSSVSEIELPESLTSIAADAFEGCKNVMVICKAGGSVAAWCQQNGVPHKSDEPLGTLVMATNIAFPPFEYYDTTGKPAGIDIDIAAAICDRLNYDVEIVNMDFDALLPALRAGRADFSLATLIATEERKEYADFTDPYFTSIQSILTTKGSSLTSPAQFLKDGAAFFIGVKVDTVAEQYCSWDLEYSTKNKILRFSTYDDAVAALVAGRLDCVILDETAARTYLAANSGLTVTRDAYSDEAYAVALPKGSELTESFNSVIQEMQADGTIQRIVAKYLTD